ncbi:MAG TPA: heavy-metal-associated domain-containing protein [Acidobacteriaceae bacterium]|jgi:copper chaperone CopZ
MSTLTLRIENMHCGSCVRRVTQTLNSVPGTHAQEVRIGSARVAIEAAPETTLQALANAGYPAQLEPGGEPSGE